MTLISQQKEVFDGLSSKSIAIVNIDDKHGSTMLHHTKAKRKLLL